MDEIQLTPGMKGIVVYAKYVTGNEWLFLLSGVGEESNGHMCGYRYASYNLSLNKFNFTLNSKYPWGYVDRGDVKFYLATEEQKKIIKDNLLLNGYKYVKALNKLIKR